MSVAFRRDGDEEHLEPKFEIPIPPGPNRVTERGLALIEERLADVRRDARKLKAKDFAPAIHRQALLKAGALVDVIVGLEKDGRGREREFVSLLQAGHELDLGGRRDQLLFILQAIPGGNFDYFYKTRKNHVFFLTMCPLGNRSIYPSNSRVSSSDSKMVGNKCVRPCNVSSETGS